MCSDPQPDPITAGALHANDFADELIQVIKARLLSGDAPPTIPTGVFLAFDRMAAADPAFGVMRMVLATMLRKHARGADA